MTLSGLSLTRRVLMAAGAAACLMALLVLAGGLTGTARARSVTRSTVHAGAAAAPACRGGGLDEWLDTNGNGAAGSVYYNLHITNLSGHTCTVSGYPGVSAVGLRGKQLGSAAVRDHTVSPHTLTLKEGDDAVAVLRIVEALNFPTSDCGPVLAAGLRVFAPGQTKSGRSPFPFEACSRTGPVYLTIQALKKK